MGLFNIFIAAIKKALEEMAEHNKKDLSDFKKYLKDEVVHGIQQTINENTQNTTALKEL